MLNKEHLTLKGVQLIVANKAKSNLGLSSKLKLAFPAVTDFNRPPFIPDEKPLNPFWISGFTEGEGSFYVRLIPSKAVRSIKDISTEKGLEVPVVAMAIGLHIREKPLLIKIHQFFNGVGSIYINNKKGSVELKVYRLNHLIDIVSHFEL